MVVTLRGPWGVALAVVTVAAGCFVLTRVEGLGAAEVSEALGLTDGHQRVLLHRARTRLRHALAAEAEAL